MVSIGSQTLGDLQDAQLETFGTGTRHFYRATEADDVERDCHKQLTFEQVKRISEQCRSSHRYPVLRKLSRAKFSRLTRLRKLNNPMGWMCAQKRPLQALRNAVHKYYYDDNDERSLKKTQQQIHADAYSPLRLNTSSLPDYLIVADDDTWINMDGVKTMLPQLYPSSQRQTIAACPIQFEPKFDLFTIPFGGFGLLWTRAALIHLLRPIHCSFGNSAKHQADSLVCQRLEQNGIGERDIFRPGMSLLDLMYEYSVAAPYLQVKQWTRERSFCFHSDWVWGYLAHYYHMSLGSARDWIHRNPSASPLVTTMDNDNKNHFHQMEGYNDSMYLTYVNAPDVVPFLGQCRNSNDFNFLLKNRTDTPKRILTSGLGDAYCDAKAHFCHRISPSHMRHLHQQVQGI